MKSKVIFRADGKQIMNPSDKKLILVGGGGHCLSVIEALLGSHMSEIYSDIVIVDNDLKVGDNLLGIPVVGADDRIPGLFQNGYVDAFITVGSMKSTTARRKICEMLGNLKFRFPSIVDKSAQVAPSAHIGNGVFAGKKVVINSCADIGDYAIINTGAIIEHSCRIGCFSHIAVGAVLCGDVEVGDDSFIGANATVIQGVKIGMKSVIGAGSIVLGDVPVHTRVIGKWGGTARLIYVSATNCKDASNHELMGGAAA